MTLRTGQEVVALGRRTYHVHLADVRRADRLFGLVYPAESLRLRWAG